MPRLFQLTLSVPQEATDEFGHVNNQRYIAWMQEAATQHSAANGWPMQGPTQPLPEAIRRLAKESKE